MEIANAYEEFTKQKLGIREIAAVPLAIESSSYLHPRILESIKKNIKIAKRYRFSFEGVAVHLTFAFPRSENAIERFLVYYSCFLIYLFKSKFGKPMRELNLTLVGYGGKKMLPEAPEESLTALHVNGGVTWSAHEEASVVVYRREEIVKVLTHEMIHAFNLDAKHIPESSESFVNEYFKIACKSATLNESFTDALACYINTAVYTHLQRPLDFDKALSKNLAEERLHIIDQSAKVLSYNGYRKQRGAIVRDEDICEETHVTSYYVIKAVVWWNLTPFLEMLSRNNMNIDVDRYLAIVRDSLPKFARSLKLRERRKDDRNMRMSKLDILKLVR